MKSLQPDVLFFTTLPSTAHSFTPMQRARSLLKGRSSTFRLCGGDQVCKGITKVVLYVWVQTCKYIHVNLRSLILTCTCNTALATGFFQSPNLIASPKTGCCFLYEKYKTQYREHIGIDKILTQGVLPPVFPSHAPGFPPTGPQTHSEHQTPCKYLEPGKKTHLFPVCLAPSALPCDLIADRQS